MDDFDDDEVARAIALSLKESSASAKPSTSNNDVETDEEDGYVDEDELFAEMKGSLKISHPTGPSTSAEPEQPPRSQLTNTFLSERALLEQERLKRQKRLRRDESDDAIIAAHAPSAKRQHQSGSSSSKPIAAPPAPKASTSTSDEFFWNGEHRPIATEHASPRKDGKTTFRLSEVLGKKDEIAFAILSSYALDIGWIYQFFDPSVPVILIAQPDASGQSGMRNILPNWIKTVPFLARGFGCMHIKLFYKNGRIRVVVTTANLIAHDYRNIENYMWLQDIPLRAKPLTKEPKQDDDDFAAILQRVLHSLNVRPALETTLKQDASQLPSFLQHPNLPLQSIEDLRRKWDWSDVKVHLVPSIAGKHEGWTKVTQTGHTRLMRAVRSMGLRAGSSKSLAIEYQGSSIGAYTTQWMNEFHWSARGNSATDWLDKSKKSREKLPYPSIKILFPTAKTVRESAGGEPGGGTMFCRRAQWDAAKFPRHLFCNSKSIGGPVLMHTKMMLGLITEKKGVPDPDTDDSDIEFVDPTAIGWVYIGSHNFTPSAWGNLSGSAFNPVMNIKNYELGIVFPLTNQQQLENAVVWERPPKPYGADGPWIQEESPYFRS
ncbi:tyrosyl-DNA phosphodiesterase-domain-containing protein [Mycena floridula]|nr:tyrosyl-DNA phosphodiesterase-domain-containing protein [Mycena floridula]